MTGVLPLGHSVIRPVSHHRRYSASPGATQVRLSFSWVPDEHIRPLGVRDQREQVAVAGVGEEEQRVEGHVELREVCVGAEGDVVGADAFDGPDQPKAVLALDTVALDRPSRTVGPQRGAAWSRAVSPAQVGASVSRRGRSWSGYRRLGARSRVIGRRQ